MPADAPTLPVHVPHLASLGKDIVADLTTANLLFEAGSLEKAASFYQRAAEQDPTQAVAHLYLAKCRFQLRDFEAADLSCQKALRLNPKLADALVLQGHLLAQKKEWSRAKESYRCAIETNPEQAIAHAMLGYAYRQLNQVNLAHESYMTAVRLDTTQFNWWADLAEISNEIGDYPTAQWAAQQALQLNPLLATAFYQLGISYQKRGELKKAEDAFAQASSTDPARILGLLNRAYILAETKGSASVLPIIEVCQAMFPRWAYVQVILGEAYLTDRNFEAALEVFQKAIKLQPTLAEPYYKMGLAYLGLGRKTEAKESFASACERSSPPSPAHLALEQILHEGDIGFGLEIAPPVVSSPEKNIS